MKQNTKDWLSYGSAIFMLISAVALAFVSFFVIHFIHSTVLAYVFEAITFAAAVFGLTLYFGSEMGKLKAEITEWLTIHKEEILGKDVTDIKKDSKEK